MRTKPHERALRRARKAEVSLKATLAERDQARGAMADCHRDVDFARREMERFRRDAEKNASIAAEFRQYLATVLHHKSSRNIAMNEAHHVTLANELAMLRLLVARGCSVAPEELAEFVARETEIAKEGSTPMTEALRRAASTATEVH
jgi:hypothetical protein